MTEIIRNTYISQKSPFLIIHCQRLYSSFTTTILRTLTGYEPGDVNEPISIITKETSGSIRFRLYPIYEEAIDKDYILPYYKLYDFSAYYENLLAFLYSNNLIITTQNPYSLYIYKEFERTYRPSSQDKIQSLENLLGFQLQPIPISTYYSRCETPLSIDFENERSIERYTSPRPIAIRTSYKKAIRNLKDNS